MSEKESKSQGQKRMAFGFAIGSVVLGTLALISGMALRPGACVVFGIVSLAVGTVALLRMKGSGLGVTGYVTAGLGVTLSGGIVIVALFGYYRSMSLPGHAGLTCSRNLMGLGSAMMVYAHEFDDQYPTASKWCDLLLQGDYVSEKQFWCPSLETRQGQSSYTFNKNIVGIRWSQIPDEVVLLFESKPGWNAIGGLEMLAPENHDGKGCLILFKDRRVEWVKRKKLAKLKWTVEETKNE